MAKSKRAGSIEAGMRSILTAHYRQRNALVCPNVPTKYSMSSVPDVHVVHPWWYGYIETKVGTDLSPGQHQFLMKCWDMAYPAVCLRFLDTTDRTEDTPVRISWYPNLDEAIAVECTVRESLKALQACSAFFLYYGEDGTGRPKYCDFPSGEDWDYIREEDRFLRHPADVDS